MKHFLTSMTVLYTALTSALANINTVDFSDVTDLTMNGDTIPVYLESSITELQGWAKQ